MPRWHTAWIALLSLSLVSAAGIACGGDDNGSPADAARLSIVTSTGVIADWTAQVARDRASVTALVSAGADVHTLQLDPGQVRSIASADLVLLNGGGLESAIAGVIAENAGGLVLELAESLDLLGPGGVAADDAQRVDPHFWLDPQLAILAIDQIAEALATLDPGSAAAYRDRAASYTADVRRVDAELRETLAALPPERRTLVTFHDGYGYFARRYGLTILGFAVEGPEEEPSAGAVADLIEAMRREGVAVVYREPQFSARVVEQIADEAGAEVRILYSLPVGEVSSYLEILRANARALSE